LAGGTARDWARIWAGTSIILINHAGKKLIFLKDPFARNEAFALQKFMGKKSYPMSENGWDPCA
jgi:hypothetical protein